MIPVNQKIALLRAAMHRHGVSAYLVPSADPHLSEYVANHWKSREWLSGFTGSAGILVVTQDHAGLWTDSRYFLQAESELAGTCITLQRQIIPHAPEHVSWLAENLPAGATIGLDGQVFSLGQLRYLSRQTSGKGIDILTNLDLITDIWNDRPAIPDSPVYALPAHYAGLDRTQKLAQIRKQTTQQGATACLITTLDDIAWSLNIRAADVDFNPVCVSFLVVDTDKAHWFVPEGKVNEALEQGLREDGVLCYPYAYIETWLRQLPPYETLLVDNSTINVQLYQAIPENLVFTGHNPAEALKAIKSDTEIHQLRSAMRKDGVAMVRLLRWLQHTLPQHPVSEFDIAEKIAFFRKEQGEYTGESFPAIIGYQANGAIVHYRPTPENAAKVYPEGILLMDSGGQYRHGTTDITRTIALGTPQADQIRANTAVLKGHIALAAAWFPEGTKGVQLDALARMYLWREGKNYGHGTGHGVGYFLNVHEGPQGITPSPTNAKGLSPFQAGMVTSNEPGYYEPGQYGIRIENLVLCVEAAETSTGKFLRFETITLCPIDLNLIDPALLDNHEKIWLNEYHHMVCNELSPLLNEEEQAWLSHACRKIV